MTDDMVLATGEQAESTRQIENSIDQVSKMANRIFDEMDERRQGSLQVIENLRRLKQAKKSADGSGAVFRCRL